MTGCHWNPTADRWLAEGETAHAPAEVILGTVTRYRLCEACSRLKRFRRLYVRLPIHQLQVVPEEGAKP